MAQLVVRNIEEEVKTGLQALAKRHGRSMEEEVRMILREAIIEVPKQKATEEAGLGTRIAARFAGIGLQEHEQIQELRGYPVQIPDFE